MVTVGQLIAVLAEHTEDTPITLNIIDGIDDTDYNVECDEVFESADGDIVLQGMII